METNNRNFINSIRNKFSKYNSPEQAMSQYNSLVQLSSGIYTEEIRFIYELLQNADDSAINSNMNVKIEIDDNSFTFCHNGTPFSEVDVKSICSVGDGGKTSDKNKTGYKGIGFKSVFTHSNNVTIVSGKYCFGFSKEEWKDFWDSAWGDKKSWIAERNNDGKKANVSMPWQIMPIPRAHTNYKHYSDYNVITQLSNVNTQNLIIGVNELLKNPELMLFLRSEHAHFIVSINNQIEFDLRKETKENNITLYESGDISSQWLSKKDSIKIPEPVKEQIARDEKTPPKLKEALTCDISFAIQVENGELKVTKDALIYSYLPTSESFNFPFVVNSNFILDAGRQGLIKDSLWNEWLFEQIPVSYIEWVAEIASEYKYENSLLSIIPDKQASGNRLLQKFNTGFDKAINSIAFLPNVDNQLLKAKDALYDDTSLSSLLPASMIVDFINKTESLNLNTEALLPKISKGRSKLKCLGVNFFGLDNLEDFFKSDSFRNYHKLENNFKLINYLFEHVRNLKDNHRIEWNQKLRNTDFIFNENNELCKPETLYIKSPVITVSFENELDFINSTVWHSINSNEQIISWLLDLGITEPDDITIIEKTLTGDHCIINKNNAIEIGQYVFSLHSKGLLSPDHYNKLNNLVLLTTDNDLKNAAFLFLPQYYNPNIAFDDFNFGFQFVSEKYCVEQNKIKDWNYFLCKIGVSDKIEKRRISLSSSAIRELYPNYRFFFDENKTQTYHARSGNVWINQIERYKIDTYSCIEHADNFEFSKLFWNSIFKETYKREIDDSGDANFQDKRSLDNNFIEWLFRNGKIFPTSQETCLIANEIFLNTKENIFLANRYLPVLKCKSTVTEEWQEVIPFKKNLSFEDYLYLLTEISLDLDNIKDNKKRLLAIYNLIAENYLYKKTEIQSWAEKNKILSINDQFISPSNLSYVLASGFEGNHIYTGDESISEELIELFRILGINIVDNIKPVPVNKNQSSALKFSLISKLAYIAFWYERKKGEILQIDELINNIESINYYQCDDIKTSYEIDGVIKEGNSVRSFIYENQLYYKGAYDNPITLLSLANHLVSILGLENFSEELKMIIQSDENSLSAYFEELGYDISSLEDSNSLELIKNTLKKYTTDEDDIPLSLNLSDNSDERSRISISQDSKELILKELKGKGFIIPMNLIMNYTIVEGVKSPDGKPIKLVLKGGRGSDIYFNPTEWLALSENNAQLFVVTQGNIVRNVSITDLEAVNETFHMRFNTQKFILTNLPVFAKFFKYLPYTHFIFKTPISSTDFMASFGLNERNSSANDLTADSLNLIE